MDNKRFTLKQLSDLTQATLIGDPAHLITGVDALDAARSEDASFLANARYRGLLTTTKAGVICIDKQTPLEEGKNFLLSDNPSLTFQQVVALFLSGADLSGFDSIHPTAVIHPTAKIGQRVKIGPHVVIDQGAEIGDDAHIHALCSIGPFVTIGAHCLIYSHVTIRERCQIGQRVILQPGCVIGSCGFGYATNEKGEHIKLEQVGTVILEDDVEIGANSTVDRARFKNTKISRGTKIDNLVQIGHNVTLGPHNIIVAQTGIAGSAKTGKHVVMGGQAGVVGHLEIADGVMIATRGGVSKSLTKPGKYAGSPVMDLSDYNRQQVHLRHIEKVVDQLHDHDKRLSDLENKR
jgi:UDP-3-O-[3-hydroxymyristoyl] glucosamine N-acyltransferase